MLTKILVTALVILGCYLYIRHQQQKSSQPTLSRKLGDTPKKAQFRWLAVTLIGLSLSASIGFFIFNWLDDRTVMTVKITSPQSGEVITYQVYKGDMKDRSFETLQGQIVRISNSERIEISEEP